MLRDGRTVDSIDCRTEAVDEDRIIRSMVNRDLAHRFPQRNVADRRARADGRELVGAPPAAHRSGR